MAGPASYYFEGDAFFNPQLQLDNAEIKSKVEALLDELRLSITQVDQLRSMMRQELEYGLAANPPRPSAFPMYNTFATKFPTGKEVGNFLGMDIGGTNLRLVYLKLWKTSEGEYKKEIDIAFYEVASKVRKSDSKTFFGFLATSVKDFVEKRSLTSLGKTIPLGFTFSFGYEQLAIDRGITVMFGINTNIPDAVGKDPVQQLQEHLKALNVPVKVVALANDATSTLIYGKYLDQETSVGLIMGSGTNVAYIEEVSRFNQISDAKKTFGEDVKRFIVNTEYCVFGDKNEADFMMTKYDRLVDANSFIPKVYVYEKLMGGAFLGESLRYILLDLAQNGLLLGGQVSKQLASKGSITTADLSAVELALGENGQNAGNNDNVTALLTRLGYSLGDITDDDRRIVTFACQLVTTRAALLVAAAVSVFVDHLAHLKVVKVACDGSLFRKHHKMSRLINTYLSAISPTQAEVFDADQASGVGVAFLAAVVCNSN